MNVKDVDIYFDSDRFMINIGKRNRRDDKKYKRLIDYSSDVDIKLIRYENSQESNHKVEELKEILYGENIIYDLYKSDNFYGIDIHYETLNLFFKKWFICKKNVDIQEILMARKSVEAIVKNNEFIVIGKKYKTLKGMYERFKNGQKVLFSCYSGINELYISKDGRIQKCADNKTEYKWNKVYVKSVDDDTMCSKCLYKYICGGRCEVEQSCKSEVLDLMNNILIWFIKIYIKEMSNYEMDNKDGEL